MVLFGPNNAGKSNILSAIDRLLGERYPTYIEMLDSDFYMRNKALHPTSTIMATFTSPYYYDRYRNAFRTIAVTYGYGGNPNEHLIHDDPFLTVRAGEKDNYMEGLVTAEGTVVIPAEHKHIGWCKDKRHFFCCSHGRCEMYILEELVNGMD